MLKRILDIILIKRDRANYIGRNYAFIMNGGWEITGRIIEYSYNYILIDSAGKIIKLDRKKITAECILIFEPERLPLVGSDRAAYDIGPPMPPAPIPAAVARVHKGNEAETDLTKRLREITSNAETLKKELGIHQTLDDEKRESVIREQKSYGSILPDDMLLPDDVDEEVISRVKRRSKNIDFGVSMMDIDTE